MLRIFSTAILAVTVGLAHADSAATNSVGAAIEQAKEIVLGVEHRVAALAAARSPASTPVIFFSSTVEQSALQRLYVATGDKVLLEADPGADAGNRMLRLGNLPPGRAAADLQATARIAGADDQQLLSVALDAEGLAFNGEDLIEIVLQDGGLLSGTTLEIKRWRADPERAADDLGLFQNLTKSGQHGITYFPPGSQVDPRLRYAEALTAHGNAERAMALLLQIKTSLPDNVRAPNALLWALARASLAAELPKTTGTLLQQLARREADALRLGRLQLGIGEAYLKRGEISQARRLIGDMTPPPGLVLEWQDLMSRILLAIDNPQAAAAIYTDQESLFFEVQRNLRQPESARKLAAYSHFNRAVAFTASGDVQRGRTWLDVVGRMQTFDRESQTLRDKANVTLGWQLLRGKAGLSASQVFNRVRLDGPFSDTALLGAGWAMLGQTGKAVARDQGTELGVSLENTQLPEYVVEALVKRRVLNPNLYGQQSLRTQIGRVDKPETEAQAAQAALRYWLELKDRDFHAAAIQEAQLAIAHAYGLLGDKAKATRQYGEAADRFEQSLKALKAARERLGDKAWLADFLERLAAAGPADDEALDPAQAWLTHVLIHATDLRFIGRYRELARLDQRIRAINRKINALSAGTPGSGLQFRALRQPLLQAHETISLTRIQERQRTRRLLIRALAASEARMQGYLAAAYTGRLANAPATAP